VPSPKDARLARKWARPPAPTVRARYGDREAQDVSFYGQTPSMADIDTRAVEFGRYFSAAESEHRTNVCLIGDSLVQKLFVGVDPIGRSIRVGNDEFMIIGIMEKIGSVLGQDQDNFVTVPLSVFLRIQGIHSSLTINVKARAGLFEAGARPGAIGFARAPPPQPARGKMIFLSAPKKATWPCGAASAELFSAFSFWSAPSPWSSAELSS